MACALVALGLTAPMATAIADTGGTAYSSSSTPKKHKAAKTTTQPGQYAPLGNRIPLRQGMHGKDVRVLQRLINEIGMRIATDGSFGHQTWAALRRFERRAGRPVNGVLDADDLTALQQFLSSGAASGFTPTPPTPTAPPELPPGSQAKVASNGLAAAPADAPDVVKQIIAAGNRIASKPYIYGGGHGHWNDRGYDCSGSVSYALHFAGLLKVSRDSTGFEHFGAKGPGQWVTIYANGGHAWMIVAGLRFDTSGLSSAGSRWQSASRSAGGYVVRHPIGL